MPLTSLPGWAEDDHAAALLAYLESCGEDDPARAVGPSDARAFFEARYMAVPVASETLLTGYYEPELDGARERSAAFPVPLHAVPDGWREGQPFASRAEIEDGDLLAGRALAWVADPLEAFLLQVQGSGRIRLPDGSLLRLGYAGKNGHGYVSIGRFLVERGEIAAEEISAQAIRAWFAVHKDTGKALLRENPSYVFFRVLEGLDAAKGPPGTMRVPLTAMRSLAVDREIVPLGSLIWLICKREFPGTRLCVAQDTGGAIKGAGRADLFCGSGREAGELAGKLNTSVRLLRFLPRGAAA